MNTSTLADRVANLRADALNLDSEGRGDIAHDVRMAMAALQRRSDYVNGLRQLADALEQHDEIPLPYHGTSSPITLMFFDYDKDNRAAMAATVRALPAARLTKVVDDTYFDLDGDLSGLKIKLAAHRNAVCERVVVGTETVTVPAQPAVEAQPEQVVDREVVEWRCTPLLAESAADETAVA